MGRTKGTLHTCDVCGDELFIDETVNTEAGINERGWFKIYHRGVPREVCKSCYTTWNSWNQNFLNIVDVMEEE